MHKDEHSTNHYRNCKQNTTEAVLQGANIERNRQFSFFTFIVFSMLEPSNKQATETSSSQEIKSATEQWEVIAVSSNTCPEVGTMSVHTWERGKP